MEDCPACPASSVLIEMLSLVVNEIIASSRQLPPAPAQVDATLQLQQFTDDTRCADPGRVWEKKDKIIKALQCLFVARSYGNLWVSASQLRKLDSCICLAEQIQCTYVCFPKAFFVVFFFLLF